MSWCGASGDTAFTNTTKMFVLGTSFELVGYNISYLISGTDLLNCLVFLLSMLAFKMRLTSIVKAINKKSVTAADFSVFVKRLPPSESRMLTIVSPTWIDDVLTTFDHPFPSQTRLSAASLCTSTTSSDWIMTASKSCGRPLRSVVQTRRPSGNCTVHHDTVNAPSLVPVTTAVCGD